MFKKLSVALATVMILAGCASKGAHDAAMSTPADANANGAAGAGIGGQPTQIGDANQSDVNVLKDSVVYFAFDSSEINDAGLAVIDKVAKYLGANPSIRVRIEGNTDERGTREYNVGLGERRASAVQSALVARGVPAGQLSVISYGEEHPVALGHDEAAWAQNRRANMVRQ